MNKNIIGRLVIGVIAAATCAIPSLAFAQTATTSDSTAQIQSLLVQIHSLQLQLLQITHQTGISGQSGEMGSSTSEYANHGDSPMGTSTSFHGHKPFCLTIMHDLIMGSHGNDVMQLQQTLSSDATIYPEGSVTGYFGPATARAVGRLQEEEGITSSTTSTPARVGPQTRALFRGWCSTGQEPSVNNIGGFGTTTPHMFLPPNMLPPIGSSTNPFLSGNHESDFHGSDHHEGSPLPPSTNRI